jgi:NADPH:quinone reductase-like Zn-dependent oxidoreductase
MGEAVMRAVSQDRFGGPDVLHLVQRPVPEPLPTEVRVRVRAAGLNPVDLGTRAGGGMADILGAPPFVLGWDVAGVIDAVAPGVTRFAVGDRVFGFPRFPHEAGAYAEYLTAPARHFAATPAALGDEQAGGLPVAGITAWHVLVDTARLQAGQRVLIHGAGGGVGHLAVQVAKARGAEVIGTASAIKHDALAAFGIDDVLDYRRERFETAVRDADLVVDLVGGDVSFRSLEVLRPGGLLVYVVSDVLPTGLASAAAARGVRATAILIEPDHAALEQLAGLAAAGALQVLIHDRIPLEAAAHAHDLAERTRPLGKVVLTC